MYGNYENICIKQEPVDIEPIVTILELPESQGIESQNHLTEKLNTKSSSKGNIPKNVNKFGLDINESYSGNNKTYVLETGGKKNLTLKKDQKQIEKLYECTICFKSYAHPNSLKFHMGVHTGENTVTCHICDRRLSSKQKLEYHLRIHTGYKPFTCDLCNKCFTKKCNLMLHLRVHSGEKPYECDICHKNFSRRSTLLIHARYHTDQRPYICNLCQKGFVAKGILDTHKKHCKGKWERVIVE